jgi:Asp/Glu/hydantoin racemase
MIRIALIHAVAAAVAPIEAAFLRHWPEVRRTNLLDDSLSGDREAAGALTPALAQRIATLAGYGVESGADGVLFTCSAFGPAIEAAGAGLSVPVLKPNEAMFEQALAIGKRIGMLATFGPAVASMEEEFRLLAAERKPAAQLETHIVPEARAALMAGDIAQHDGLIAAAAEAFEGCDTIMLAHFSMATAEERATEAVSLPVLAAPSAAVKKLRSAVEARR